MAKVRVWVRVKAVVVTEATSSCGWMNWMRTNSMPAKTAQEPAADEQSGGDRHGRLPCWMSAAGARYDPNVWVARGWDMTTRCG